MSKVTDKIVEVKNKAVDGVKKHKGAIIGGAVAVVTGIAGIAVAKLGFGGGDDFVDEYDYEEDDVYEYIEDSDDSSEDEESEGEAE